MKNTDNTENKKHGCFTPIDKLPDGASVIDPPKDFEPMSGSGSSGSGSSPKIEACKGKEEGEGCSWVIMAPHTRALYQKRWRQSTALLRGRTLRAHF